MTPVRFPRLSTLLSKRKRSITNSKQYVPIQPPSTGMITDEPRESMIRKMMEATRINAHPVALRKPDGSCKTCDTGVLLRTFESYSDDLLRVLYSYMVSREKGNGAYLGAHHGGTENHLRALLALWLDKDLERLFSEVGRKRNFMPRHAAAASDLYVTVAREETPEYYVKLKALTGAVLKIMEVRSSWHDSLLIAINPLLSYYEVGHIYPARIADDALVDFICANPDQWEGIAEMAARLQTSDPDLIQSSLHDYSAVTLRGGIL